MSSEFKLVHQESQLGSLTLLREPSEVLADAQKVAAALMEVVKGKKKQITFNGETYLESGDWQTVAAFHGVTAKVEFTRFVEYGDVKGFEAAAVAIDRNGQEVSRGEAMCLNDEENWGTRTKYEWVDVLDAQGKKIWEFNAAKGKNLPKREKVATGVTVTPLFQLRSMAQTRACAKALSNLFKWVVVLAGYKPTPAEEMTGRVDDEPDLPSEHQNSSAPSEVQTSHQPAGAPHAAPPVQPVTQPPAAPQTASQSRVGPTKRIPPTPPENEQGLICTVKRLKESPKKGAVNANISVVFDEVLNGTNQGVAWVCSYATCWHASLFDALRQSVGKECQFHIKERDAKLNNSDEWPIHFIDIEDVVYITDPATGDYTEYVEGKPVIQAQQ